MGEENEIMLYQNGNRGVELTPSPVSGSIEAPRIVYDAGPAAQFAWDEFFQGELANAYTRRNYVHAIQRFLAWAEGYGLELARITPGHVGSYFQQLPLAVPTKKLHLAAIRKFFDRLVVRHAVVINPAATVKTERYAVVEGKTPEIRPEQARVLLASIDVTTVVGLRDRAILSVLVYTAARVGAVARLAVKDFRHDGTQYSLRFAEKGGKSREIPVRHDLEQLLLAYVTTAGLKEGPLFRSAIRKTGQLSTNGMSAIDICRMMKRRLREAGLPNHFSPHSFRVATVTDLLEQNQPLEDVQHLAGHADPRTTRLYDRRRRKVTRNIVERISI